METADDLYAQAMAPTPPMEYKDEGVQESQPSEQVQEKPSSDDGRALVYKGQEIKIDDDKYKMLAQKGYSYEKDMHQLKVDRKLWENEKTKEMGSLEELREIQEYTKENPAFQSLIQREWAKIQGGSPVSSDVQTQQQSFGTDEQLNAVLQRLNKQEEYMRAQEEAKKEADLEMSVSTYKDAYGTFDWSTKDELGQTLEDKITQHAIDNKIGNFKTAANDYLFDEHIKRASLESKEQAAKKIQEQHKLGLGKVTSESQLKIDKVDGVRKKSYNDLAAEALKDLGLG